MNKSESIKELATALAAAQAEVENASKNSNNPHFRSKYADLAEVINTVRPVFSKHGLSVTQWPSFADGVASVETLLAHKSGEWLSSTASAPVSKQDAQGVGSAITYLRRYSLAAVAGVAQEDDDGNASIGKTKQSHGMGQLDKKNLPAPDADEPIRPSFADTVDAILKGLDSGDDFKVYENATALNNAEKMKAKNDGLITPKQFNAIRTIIDSIKKNDGA